MSSGSGNSGLSDTPDPSGAIELPGLGGDSESSDFHRSTRMPLDAVVRLHFEGTVAYQNGFAANVSATGMYVKHPDPPPLGTRLVFELVLGEERKPVQGAGFVAWAREKYEGPGRPAGVGIQFTEIDSLSRQHIAEALFAYLETQLGDELAESQDVVDLVATTSTRSPAGLIESLGRSSAEALASSARIDTPSAPLPPIAPAAARNAPEAPTVASPLFRRIDEKADEAPYAVGGGLFTPEIPPDDLIEARALASRRPKSPWPAVAIGVAIAGAAFAGWWFLAGPGSLAAPSPAAATPAAVEPRTEAPARPALSPEPGTATTLAQAVGAEAVQAPEPLPIDAAPDEEASAPDAAAPGTANPETAAAAAVNEPAEPLAAPAPAASPTATAAQAAAVVRMSRITSIDWEESSDLTVVVLTGDGAFPAGGFKWNEIRDANPRVLLRLMQMSAGYPKPLLAAGTPELKQLRIGYHEKPAGNELHVVLDLAAPAVRVASVEASGNRLYVRLARQ